MRTKVSIRRRILYTLATACFIASSFAVTLYSFGYRFSFEHGIFIHSGTITLKTTPRRVNISLDEKEMSANAYDLINNSYNINGLKPGTYTIEVTSPGYNPWKKTISVHSGISTEFWNVVLTAKEPAKKRLDVVSPINYKIASSGDKIVYATRANGPLQIFLYFPKKEGSVKIFEEPVNQMEARSLESMEFSPDENSLVFTLKEGDFSSYYLAYLDEIESNGANNTNVLKLNVPLADFQGKLQDEISRIEESSEENFSKAEQISAFLKNSIKVSMQPGETEIPSNATDKQISNAVKKEDRIDPSKITPGTFADFRWIDNDVVYFMHKDSLYAFYLNREEVRFVLEGLRGYEISQGNIFFVKAPNNLVFKSDRTGAEMHQITENMIDQDLPPETQRYKLNVYDETRMTVTNQNGELYLFNNSPDEYQVFKKIADKNRGVQFSDDGKKLLYFNEDEIKVYYVREWDVQPKNSVGSNVEIYRNKKDKIQDALWHKDYQHVIFSEGGAVKIIEIDLRDQMNIMDIVKSGESNPQFTLNTNNEILYFKDSSDKFVQLFELELNPAKGIGEVFQ